MFSSRFFRSAYRVISRLRVAKTEKANYSKFMGLGAMATGMALFSVSSALCNADHIKELIACGTNEIPEGTMKRVQVGSDEENFILISRVCGQYYATGGKCSHYGAPLQFGFLDGYSVVCPWHAAAFDVRTGEMTQSPGMDSIPTYPVKIVNGNVVVEIPESKYASVAGSVPSKRMAKRDLTNNACFVVIGGGAAGSTAVETLRKEGFTGRIIMLTSEKQLPYDRVVLSKSFEADSSKLGLRETDFYNEFGIEVEMDAEVKSIDQDKKVISLKNGKTISYDKALLATGCTAKVPGLYRKYLDDYSNVFTIRNAQDHTRFKGTIGKATDIVIIGAGFIGLEAAASIKKTWPGKNVTVITPDPKPISNILGSEIASQLITTQSINGVNMLVSTKINSFNGSEGKVTSLSIPGTITFLGQETITELKADCILIATGAQINSAYAPVNLTNPDGSVRVNSHLQTENSSIYAAGDIAQFPSLLTESRERIEHWGVAQQQGRVAALNMLEKGNNYLDVPFFWSNQFLNVSFAGFSAGHDWSYTETKGEDLPMKTARITYFFKGERCIGVAAVNWPGAVLRLKIALHRGLMPTRKELTSKQVAFENILEKVKNSNPCGGNCCRR